MPSNSSSAIGTPQASTGLSPSTAAPSAYTADEVIAELKHLAQSMLEASKEARRRVLLEDDTATKSRSASLFGQRNGFPARVGSHQQHPSPSAMESRRPSFSVESPSCWDSGPHDNSGVAVRGNTSEIAGRHQDPAGPAPLRSEAEDDGEDEYLYHCFDAEDDELDLTLTCFKSGERRMFERFSAALWVPEPVRRHPDGSFAGCWDPKCEEDEAAQQQQERETDNAEAMPVAGQSRAYKRRSANSSTGSSSSERGIKTFRVPLFPYGGGVTGQQLKALTQQYDQCGKRSTARHGTPLLVRRQTFVERGYVEITPSHHRFLPLEPSASPRSLPPFCPVTLYDFVVEVELGVQFDPVKARRERQQEFKRLVKENRAPVTMGTFHLKVIMDPTKTGFEDERTFPINRGGIIADRYQIAQLIAKSTFSRTVRCYDLEHPIYEEEEEVLETPSSPGAPSKSRNGRPPIGYQEVCIKIIHNSKDFFDQSLDEIRLLRLLNQHKDPDAAHIIRLLDAFYYKEHCMLVTELLSDSLYEFSRYNREEEDGLYFTIPRLQRITRQIIEALVYVHSLNLIHADLKPENILFVSHRRCIVKVIDFGSSSFLSDHLSSYIQSRNYRAPEVILGCDYDGRIDIWSLGAILVELVLGEVLFSSSTVPEMLARMVVECGQPLPRRMMWEGRYTHNFITRFGAIYEVGNEKRESRRSEHDTEEVEPDVEESYYVYTPHPQPIPPTPPSSNPTELEDHRYVYHHADGSFVQVRKKLLAAGTADPLFTNFVEKCLTLDHKKRPTSKELLQHPFIKDIKV